MKTTVCCIAILFLFLMGLTSCKKERYCCGEPQAALYKLKGDYINNVVVFMNNSKTAIKGYPGGKDGGSDTACHPLALVNNYYLDWRCSYGPNSAYLVFTRSEYHQAISKIPIDCLIYYVLDRDPYKEYYVANYSIPNDSVNYDSTSLNKMIREGRIELYFDKIK